MADIITIGRDPKSTIRVSDQFDTVSNEHADIRQDGVEIIFTDHSSNGTLINGQKIQRRSVNIYRGDSILLAGTFQLTWPQIEHYLRPIGRPTVARNIRSEVQPQMPATQGGRDTMPITHASAGLGKRGGRPTDMLAANHRQNESYQWQRDYSAEAPAESIHAGTKRECPEIDKWNWGAFFFGWIWGVFNKVYLGLLQLILFILGFGMLVLGLHLVASLFYAGFMAMAVWLGVKGSRMAWNNDAYADSDDFLRMLHNWNVAALVCLFAIILFVLLMLLFFMDMVTLLF